MYLKSRLLAQYAHVYGFFELSDENLLKQNLRIEPIRICIRNTGGKTKGKYLNLFVVLMFNSLVKYRYGTRYR